MPIKSKKAVDIFKTAILVYNNILIPTRSETFIVLSNIAWTYLIHVHLVNQGILPIYRTADESAVLVDGQEKLWELSHCLRRTEVGLSQGERANLIYLIAIRNAVEHRSAEDINDAIQAKIQANALNFLSFVKRVFGSKYDFSNDLAFAIQLQALTMQSPNALTGKAPVAKAVATVNALLEDTMTQAEFDDPAYAFRVYVVPKTTNNIKKADQAVTYSPVGSDVEVAIKLVERPKYRMNEARTKLMNDGFVVTKTEFQRAWQGNNLKSPDKGYAVHLGGQWFWYKEGIDKIREIIEAQRSEDRNTAGS